MRKDELTGSWLEKVLSYDPLTGVFLWKVNLGGRLRAGTRAGCPNEAGYTLISIFGRHYRASCLAWLWMTGKWPREEVDHKDCNPANDAFGNLREATSAQNKWNTRIQKNHSGNLKGAYFHAQTGKWRAQIMKHRKLYCLGLFVTEEEAHAAYCARANELFGEFARAA
jgi:hypothetical protein